MSDPQIRATGQKLKDSLGQMANGIKTSKYANSRTIASMGERAEKLSELVMVDIDARRIPQYMDTVGALAREITRIDQTIGDLDYSISDELRKLSEPLWVAFRAHSDACQEAMKNDYKQRSDNARDRSRREHDISFADKKLSQSAESIEAKLNELERLGHAFNHMCSLDSVAGRAKNLYNNSIPKSLGDLPDTEDEIEKFVKDFEEIDGPVDYEVKQIHDEYQRIPIRRLWEDILNGVRAHKNVCDELFGKWAGQIRDERSRYEEREKARRREWDD